MTGLEFKKIRQALGLTQQQLADMMGMWQTHISRIERGNPTKQQAAFIGLLKAQEEENAKSEN